MSSFDEWIHEKPKPGSAAAKYDKWIDEWIHEKPKPGSSAAKYDKWIDEWIHEKPAAAINKDKFAIEQKARVKVLQDEENARNAAKDSKAIEDDNRRADEEAAMDQCMGPSCGLSFFNRTKKAGNRRRRTKKTRRGKSKKRGRKTRGRRR